MMANKPSKLSALAAATTPNRTPRNTKALRIATSNLDRFMFPLLRWGGGWRPYDHIRGPAQCLQWVASSRQGTARKQTLATLPTCPAEVSEGWGAEVRDDWIGCRAWVSGYRFLPERR